MLFDEVHKLHQTFCERSEKQKTEIQQLGVNRLRNFQTSLFRYAYQKKWNTAWPKIRLLQPAAKSNNPTQNTQHLPAKTVVAAYPPWAESHSGYGSCDFKGLT